MVNSALSNLDTGAALATGDLIYVVQSGNSRKRALTSLNANLLNDTGQTSIQSTLGLSYRATIAEMTALSDDYLAGAGQVIVTDVDRGGLFKVLSGTPAANGLTANSGTVFASDGGGYTFQRGYQGPVNIAWFDTTGDGVADDTAEVNAALSAFDDIHTNDGETYLTTLTNFNSVTKRVHGRGQIDTTGGKLPPNYAYLNAAPSQGSPASFLTAFDGDLSGSLWVGGHSVNGTSMTEPATGYKFVEETALTYGVTYFTSGHNEETAGNDGRTGYVQNQRTIFHLGQGDAIVHHAKVSVQGQKTGATHFLASPAGVLYGGSVVATKNYQNLTYGETTFTDGGFECRATGPVINFVRNNAGATLEAFWNGMRLQSSGTQDVDAGYQVSGTFNVGFDCTPATISGAAMAMKAGQRIEAHASATADSAGILQYADTLNGWDWGYNSAATAHEWRTAGTARLRLSAGSLSFIGAGTFVINGSQILTTRRTGWGAPTGTSTKTTFDTATVTLSGLAERVKALIADLTAHGIIGS